MKKSARTAAKKNKRKARQSDAKAAEPTRRDVLKLAKIGALGGVALGAGGWWVVSGVQATAAEQDLSRIGQGLPTVVQIHDPTCSQCTALQRQTRKALKCYDNSDLTFLVASIRTEDGQAFAARYGVPHVTLMFFNADGSLQASAQGVRPSEEVKSMIAAHLDV